MSGCLDDLENVIDLVITNPFTEYEHNPTYLLEEIKAIRGGWYNPRKVNMPMVLKTHKIPVQIRNQLPRKMRKIDG